MSHRFRTGAALALLAAGLALASGCATPPSEGSGDTGKPQDVAAPGEDAVGPHEDVRTLPDVPTPPDEIVSPEDVPTIVEDVTRTDEVVWREIVAPGDAADAIDVPDDVPLPPDDVPNPCPAVADPCVTVGAVRCDDGAARTCVDVGGGCLGWSAPVACEDADPCTRDTCVEGEGCRSTAIADGGACDDGDPCTLGDACADGACEGPERNPACRCDGEAADWCETVHGDGDRCNGTSSCDRTLAEPSCAVDPDTIVDCAPPGTCRTATCDPATGGCGAADDPDGTPCEDLDVRCGRGICDGGACVASPTVPTDDVTCDGADDDCDGKTDEDCATGRFRLRGAGVAAGGVVDGETRGLRFAAGATLRGDASDGTYRLVAPASGGMTGVLRDATGTPVEGTLAVHLRLYASPDGAALGWSETHAAVEVRGGAFVVALGSIVPLPVEALRDGAAYVGVRVGSGDEMTPRLALHAAPLALRAGDTTLLDGAPLEDYVQQAALPMTEGLVRDERVAGYALETELVPQFSDRAYGGRYDQLADRPPLDGFAPEGRRDTLAEVARTGLWSSLVAAPDLDLELVRKTELKAVATSGRIADLSGVPDFTSWATVADFANQGVVVSGSFDDLTGVPAALWCASHCPPRVECRAQTCDGAAVPPTCTPQDLPDGSACGGGEGRCVGGVCHGALCGGGMVSCPYLAGYLVACNAADHCEYTPLDRTGWREFDVWIWVPPGTFAMGAPVEEAGSADSERPVREVHVRSGYFVAKYEVTVAQYAACVADERRCTDALATNGDAAGWGANPVDSRPRHPQNALTWAQAREVCAWATPGGRLPTEAEWEYAASGPTHRTWPWGTITPTCAGGEAIFDEDGGNGRPWGCDERDTHGVSGTREVTTAGAGSAVGAIHMSGNVSEWVADAWNSTYTGPAPTDGSAWGTASGGTGVLRGGSFASAAGALRSAARDEEVAMFATAFTGARCVRPRD